MTTRSITALLPMKGQSERVPGKNVRPLCGRPLFYWVLDALSESRYVHEIVIDTDSEEIAQLARDEFEVTILMRPPELHGHMVGITPLIEFQLSQVPGEYFLQTHSCNPMVRSETFDRAAEAFFDAEECDSLFSVTPLYKRLYWPEGAPVNHDPANMLRTQDMAPIYEENSNIYIFSRDSFQRCRHRIGANPVMFPMDAAEALDIDDEHEFTLAEFSMSRRLKSAAGPQNR